jgi:hypothetical protein
VVPAIFIGFLFNTLLSPPRQWQVTVLRRRLRRAGSTAFDGIGTLVTEQLKAGATLLAVLAASPTCRCRGRR